MIRKLLYLLFLLIFFLIPNIIFAQKKDSLLKIDVTVFNDTQKIKYYLALTREYIPTKEFNKGVATARIGSEIARKKNYEVWEAKCKLFMGVHYQNHISDSALLYFTQALAIFKKYNHDWRIFCLDNLSSIYRNKAMYTDALDVRQDITTYYLSKKDTALAGEALINYGFIFDRMKNYEFAIQKYRQAIEWARATKNNTLYGKAMGYIGIAKDELGEYDSAHYYNFIALNIYKKINDIDGLHPWYSNIANTYIKQKKWVKAEEYMKRSLDGLDYNYQTIKLSNLGKIYAKTGRYEQAEELLNRAVKNSIQFKTLGHLSESYFNLYELYTTTTKPKKALEFHIKHKEIEDSITSMNKRFQLDVIQLKEDTARQEEQLNQASSLIKNRNVLIIILLLSLTFIGFIIYYLIKKQKLKTIEQEMAYQQKMLAEKERISRDLHDNIGSQLTFLIAGTHKEQLHELNQFARDTLDQLRNTVWAIKKNKIKIADFDIELSNYIDKLKGKTTVEILYTSSFKENIILSPTVTINLFRILQEALSNTLRHANASKISIKLEFNGTLRLIIQDNGQGIVEKGLQGHGLKFMTQRIEEIAGTLSISSKNNGTRIIAQAPQIM